MIPDRLYLDNAATSFPKPPCVIEAMTHFANRLGASPGRGAYREAVEASGILTRCRDRLSTLFLGARAEHVVFTLNTSDALNLAMFGLVDPVLRGGRPAHIVTTDLDHNSILRPCRALEARGATVTRLPGDPITGVVDPDDVAAAIGPNTVLVATLHGSNVTGRVQPITDIGAACRARDVPFLVDAAQTLGHRPVDVSTMNIDLLAFPGHKGLLGPLGTGGLYIAPGLEHVIEPIRVGGTGSSSEHDTQPDFMPDRFEPGSHNAIGLAGLDAALGWLLERGIETLWHEERQLIERMDRGLEGIDGLHVLGGHGGDRCGVFAVTIGTADDGPAGRLEPEALAAVLEDRFGILTRAGLHCAPRAHAHFGTDETGGAVRLSLGPFLHHDDVDRVIHALEAIAADMHAGAAS